MGPKTRPPYLLAEDKFVDIFVDMSNSIATELFVNMVSAPPRIFIGGTIVVTLQVPRPFFLKKRERLLDISSGWRSKTTRKEQIRGTMNDVNPVQEQHSGSLHKNSPKPDTAMSRTGVRGGGWIGVALADKKRAGKMISQ